MTRELESAGRKRRKPARTGRVLVLAAALVIVLLGAGLLLYDRMADRLLAALAEEAIVNGPASERVEADGSDRAPASSEPDDYRPELTQEQAEQVREKVTLQEKFKLGSVLLRHWSTEELSAFESALQGGLTLEEKREMKRKVLSKLGEEEYDELIEIAEKYGLSQGKSYEESLEE